jgi:hypothetical protein
MLLCVLKLMYVMQGQAGSRKRITLNYPTKIIRFVLSLCLLGSVAAFAATRTPAPLIESQQTAPALSASSRIVLALDGIAAPQSSTVDSEKPLAETQSLANLDPISDSNTFRLLWVAAGFGLILALRRQRRRV